MIAIPHKNTFAFISVLIFILSAVTELYWPGNHFIGYGFVLSLLTTLFVRRKIFTIIVSLSALAFMVISFIRFKHFPTEQWQYILNERSFSIGCIVMATAIILYIKNLEKEIGKESMQMQSLFENATEGIILANSRGHILLANPRAETMFGYRKEELINSSIELLIPQEFREMHPQHRKSFSKNPQNRSMGIGRDLFALKKDGSNFPVEISLSHYKVNNELFVIAYIIDITVRKHNETISMMQRKELEKVYEEIKVLNSELERKVEDRTTMLKETLNELQKSKDELSRSLKKERELGELKSQFVSMASHEFRTPLSIISSSASLIARYPKEEEEGKRNNHINKIQESVKNLNSILEDFLSLGKLEEGLVVVNYVLFPLKDFMEDLLEGAKNFVKSGQVLNYSQDEQVGEVIADKKLLNNILLNLLSNAVKFSPEQSTIDITAHIDKKELSISIKDSGIGITEEEQVHLFERFFRARNAVNIQGTGLGLYIVSRYLKLMGGNISLSSKINEGTTFTIYIPQQHKTKLSNEKDFID
jgi:PAS domain S-box-containing protein